MIRKNGFSLFARLFQPWPSVTAEEVATLGAHLREGNSVQLSNNRIILDSRARPGRWARFLCLDVKRLTLCADGDSLRLKGAGILERDDWSHTDQGTSESKETKPIRLDIRLRITTEPPRFEVLNDVSEGLSASYLVTAKLLEAVFAEWHSRV